MTIVHTLTVCVFYRLKVKLEKDKPERVEEFTKGMQDVVKKIVKNIKNYEVNIQTCFHI